MGAGAITNFATNATDFRTKFPGIKPTLMTLEGNFWFPFYRDFLMSIGECYASFKFLKVSHIMPADPQVVVCYRQTS